MKQTTLVPRARASGSFFIASVVIAGVLGGCKSGTEALPASGGTVGGRDGGGSGGGPDAGVGPGTGGAGVGSGGAVGTGTGSGGANPSSGTGGSTLDGGAGGAGNVGVGGGASGGSSKGGAGPTGGTAGSQGGATGTGAAAGGGAAGPFGITTRALKQTCVPPADMYMPVAKLSATGCMDPADVKKPAPSLIPYDVASPLWSDGAAKQRFMAIPDGATIHVKNCTTEPDTCKPAFQGGTSSDEGHWDMPVGTVLVKNFLFAGKLVETRLFVRFQALWTGYSYQWNAQQTEATIVDQYGVSADVVNDSGATQKWTFPSRNDCLECHNDTVGRSIGPDTRQLNWSMTYPSGVTANQIATLEHLGLFDAPVVRMAALSDYRVTTLSNEERVRSYLHANCATCHRPDGNYSSIDLRYGVSLLKMNICNLDPNKGDFGHVGAKRLIPADPANSLMLLRMQALTKDTGRMPQLGTSVLDATGIDLVTKWIQGITSCPM